MKMWHWLKELVLKNGGITNHEVAKMLGISTLSVESILKQNLNMCHSAARFMFCT
jgi:predicted transcriptional regulator